MGQVAWFRGVVPADVLEAVRGATGDDSASFARSVGLAVARLGFVVHRNASVELATGRGGRIDVIAIRGSETLAIECDRKSPRMSSVRKLGRCAYATGKLVVCREAA